MSDADPLTPAQQEAWQAFGPLLAMLPPALNAHLSTGSGLTLFEYTVLADLLQAPELTKRVSGLAACLGTTKPRMSRVAGRLESLGHVTRAVCPSDGRATNVTLTDKGAKALSDATPVYLEWVRQIVFSPLDDQQVDQLRDIAGAILHRYRPDNTSPLDRLGPTPAAE